jgi:hypothetical protein
MARPSTRIPLNEDHPRLAYGTLKRAGLDPGKVTLWGWNTPAGALVIRVVGGRDDTFTITSEGSAIRVARHQLRYLLCPACGATVRYLLWRSSQWGCRLCRGVDYRIRHVHRTTPILTRLAILHALGRTPVLSLKAARQRYRLARVNRAILEKASKHARRTSSGSRGRRDPQR